MRAQDPQAASRGLTQTSERFRHLKCQSSSANRTETVPEEVPSANMCREQCSRGAAGREAPHGSRSRVGGARLGGQTTHQPHGGFRTNGTGRGYFSIKPSGTNGRAHGERSLYPVPLKVTRSVSMKDFHSQTRNAQVSERSNGDKVPNSRNCKRTRG